MTLQEKLPIKVQKTLFSASRECIWSDCFIELEVRIVKLFSEWITSVKKIAQNLIDTIRKFSTCRQPTELRVSGHEMMVVQSDYRMLIILTPVDPTRLRVCNQTWLDPKVPSKFMDSFQNTSVPVYVYFRWILEVLLLR